MVNPPRPSRPSRRQEEEDRFYRDLWNGRIDANAEPPEYDDYPDCVKDDSDE